MEEHLLKTRKIRWVSVHRGFHQLQASSLAALVAWEQEAWHHSMDCPVFFTSSLALQKHIMQNTSQIIQIFWNNLYTGTPMNSAHRSQSILFARPLLWPQPLLSLGLFHAPGSFRHFRRWETLSFHALWEWDKQESHVSKGKVSGLFLARAINWWLPFSNIGRVQVLQRTKTQHSVNKKHRVSCYHPRLMWDTKIITHIATRCLLGGHLKGFCGCSGLELHDWPWNIAKI